MLRQLKNPSLGVIGVVGILLGLLAWWLIGPNDPQSQNPLAPTAVHTPQPTATAEVWQLPTLPVFNWSQSPLEGTNAVVGGEAPDFELLDRDGNSIRLSDLRGKAVVINFWATWCPPCREEMPELQAIATEYADKGLVVLGVNTTYADSRADALKFTDELGLTFPILFDGTGETTEKSYGVFGLPVTFWIDPQGIIKTIIVGPSTHSEMVELANRILAP